MAELFVRNSLNSRKSVKINIALREFILSGEEGDRKWVLELGTHEPTASGINILPEVIYNISESNIENEVENAIARICSQIDWSDFEIDREAPYMYYSFPTGDNVPIKSVIRMTIKDDLPSSGVDLSEMIVTFNNGDVDFDITSEIEISGDPYEYKLFWPPPKIDEV